jgi:hypothetical protein
MPRQKRIPAIGQASSVAHAEAGFFALAQDSDVVAHTIVVTR